MRSSSARQRRGKTAPAAPSPAVATATATASTRTAAPITPTNHNSTASSPNNTTATAAVTGNTPTSLQERLELATASICYNFERTKQLHLQWRTYLLRLSYLVVLLTLHQSQPRVAKCLASIKAYNVEVSSILSQGAAADNIADSNATGAPLLVSGWMAVRYALADSLGNLGALILASALCFWLTDLNQSYVAMIHTETVGEPTAATTKPPHAFARPAYQIAVLCLPVILTSHFGQAENQLDWMSRYSSNSRNNNNNNNNPTFQPAHEGEASSMVHTASCLGASATMERTVAAAAAGPRVDESPVDNGLESSSLSVAVVYLVICSGCLWFMEWQYRQQAAHVQEITKMQRDYYLSQQQQQGTAASENSAIKMATAKPQ